MSAQFNKGDILVFKTEDDWISKCIAFLTKSDVSHAVMVYGDNTIVEMDLPGIGVCKITEAPNGREVYVMRHVKELNPEPLIKAADAYIYAETEYDIPAIVLLAGLIIYQEIRPNDKFTPIADLIMRLACVVIDTYIQEKTGKGKTMVCSQLVYQIYSDSGEDYRIKGHFQLRRNSPGLIKLATLLEDVPAPKFLAYKIDEINQDPQELARQLYVAMTESENRFYSGELDVSISEANVKIMLQSANQLLERLKKLLEQCGSDLPINSMFVTPCDLVYNTTNLQRVGIVKINVER